MVGSNQTEAVVAYLSRLTGEEILVSKPVQLRSIHRAAFASWAQKQAITVRRELLAESAPFLLSELLSTSGALPGDLGKAPASLAPVPSSEAAAPFGIGIDIEEVDCLPEAGDYREHPFFQDNFTAAEIAHCICQADVRASFCGTWAAKEAILKAGLVAAPGTLRHIEILRDRQGRPSFGQCSLSVSHTARTAVAVCVVTPSAGVPKSTPGAVAPAANVTPAPAPEAVSGKRGFWSRLRS